MKKEKPHFEICPLCRKIASEVNFPKKNAPKQWSNCLCFECEFYLAQSLRKLRERFEINPDAKWESRKR